MILNPHLQKHQTAFCPCLQDTRQAYKQNYTNSIAVLQLLSASHNRQPANKYLDDLRIISTEMKQFVENDSYVDIIKGYLKIVGPTEILHFIGQTPKEIVLAEQAALTFMEGAKCYTNAFSIGSFKHGPMELAKANHRAVIFASSDECFDKKLLLANRLAGYGSKVLFVTDRRC